MDAEAQLRRSLADRYEIEREIGAGGMATVYLAHDTRHDRPVALKLLKPDLGAVLGVERFLSEIKVTANLQHPNLLPLFDSGAVDGLLYYVMPFVEGESLRSRLEREKQLPIDDAIRITVAIANALDYAHSHGVIHRDLKPANVLISKEENGQLHVRVLDFGLAKISLSELTDTNSPTAQLTTPGMVVGTMGYMSPEQLRGDTVDERSDLFSVGVMVVEVLSGSRPFRGPTYTELLSSILHGSFHLEGGSKEAEQLDAVLQKCLAKDRERRFSSAGEMQRELIPAMREYRLVGTQKWSSAEADTLLY